MFDEMLGFVGWTLDGVGIEIHGYGYLIVYGLCYLKFHIYVLEL